MQGEVHEGPGLDYLTVLPDDYDPEASYPLVVMLHGFGANMHDLAGAGAGDQPYRLRLRLPQRPHALQSWHGPRQFRLDDAPGRLDPGRGCPVGILAG